MFGIARELVFAENFKFCYNISKEFCGLFNQINNKRLIMNEQRSGMAEIAREMVQSGLLTDEEMCKVRWLFEEPSLLNDI